jgi:hypothetical protein
MSWLVFCVVRLLFPVAAAARRLWLTHYRKEWAVVALKGGGRTFFWSL